MKVCVCDDNRVFGEELKSKLLKSENGAKVSCYSGANELLSAIERPDFVLRKRCTYECICSLWLS